jgi:hypothetical protein
MNRRYGTMLGLALLAIPACSGATDEAPAEQQQAAALAVTAAGSIPAGLPSHMMVGLFENQGGTWLSQSGVPWDMRYSYFTYGWANNWGYGARDGSWGGAFLSETGKQGFVPAVEYYCVNGEPGGDESQFLAKTQNATTMAEYFGDFKLLMQQVKTFGKPVVVLLEADGFGFMEQQSSNAPNTAAAIASTGMPELASLPNTVAGWGLAFLAIRQAVGASNALLGIHVSSWASGNDISYGAVTIPLQPEVDTVYNFLAPLGLAANVTGATYDFLVGDPLDRDSDYYSLEEGQNRWWDATDTASVSSESFNRFASWLGLWNVKAGKRWILWQIPLGNSNHLDVCNNGGAQQGYKDNRPEYFFGTESALHLANWAQDGVVGLLFGAGATCQSSYGNDIYTDGQSFIQSRVGSFYAAGGLPLGSSATGAGSSGSSGSTTGSSASASSSSASGSSSSSSGSTAGSSSGSSGDSSEYGFETGNQGWTATSGSVSVSNAELFAGKRALAVPLSSSSAFTQTVSVASPATPAGATVTFHVWLPSGANVSSVQPYVMQGASGGWAWTGQWEAVAQLKLGAWNTITVTVPSNAATPLYQLGVQIATSGASSAVAYVDAVSW